MPEPRDESLHVLQHALGLDDFGQGRSYRNHYVAGPDHYQWGVCMEHVAAGRMERLEPRAIFGGDYCFVVTEAGREFVRERSPRPPKLSRAKRTYRAWLRSGADMPFGEWLRAGCRKAVAGG